MLEARRLLATLDFVGLDLTFNARAGIANTVTVSQSGDTYTFTTDSADKITAFNNAPSNYKYKVQGLGKNTVTITSVDASISSITFNLGDNDDSFRVISAMTVWSSVEGTVSTLPEYQIN